MGLVEITNAHEVWRHGSPQLMAGLDSPRPGTPVFLAGWEDVDLCLRLGERGHEIHYCHESVVYHLESVSRDTHSHQEEANRRLYAQRWHAKVASDDLRYYLDDDLLQISYSPWYPFHLTASPLLAVIGGAERTLELERLLAVRSWQVHQLLRRTIELDVEIREMKLRSELGSELGLDDEVELPAV